MYVLLGYKNQPEKMGSKQGTGLLSKAPMEAAFCRYEFAETGTTLLLMISEAYASKDSF